MKLKEIIGQTTFLICGMVNKENNFEKIKYLIDINKDIINQCGNLVVILNRATDISDSYFNNVLNLYKSTFNHCIVLKDHINRGHQIGFVDLDKTGLFFIKNNLDTQYTLKISMDILITENLLNLEVDENADLYFLPSICITHIYSEYDKLIINHGKTTEYNDSQPHYHIWFYIIKNNYDCIYESDEEIQRCFDEWIKKGYKDVSQNLVLASEHSFVKFTVLNKMKRCSLFSRDRFKEHLEFIKKNQVFDSSMKNINFTKEGIMHWHNKNIVQTDF